MNGYPLKHIRLRELEDAGFNVADHLCFPPKELSPLELRCFFDRYQAQHGISLRHFHEDETRFFKCPVKYEVKDWDTALRFCQEHNRDFYTLVNEAIPIQDSLFGGNIWLLHDDSYVVEYFAGPGSPRDTEHKELKSFTRAIGVRPPSDTPSELLRLPPLFRNFVPHWRPIVIEFNIYPYVVGKKKRKVIVWEWRQGLIHEHAEVIAMLSTENERLRIENKCMFDMLVSAAQGCKPSRLRSLLEQALKPE